MSDRPAALFAMHPQHLAELFPPATMARLQRRVEIDTGLVVQDFTDPALARVLAETQILITGWGCPRLDEQVLDAAPRLRAVLHAAGSVRSLVTDACWDRGLTVSSAAQANALPVAEYTLAMILLAGKSVFSLSRSYRNEAVYPLPRALQGLGNNGRTVGIIGASRIGKRVLELLRPFDLRALLFDPYADQAQAAALGARLVPLDDLLSNSDIVSVHAPDIPATRGMLSRERLALIKDGGVVINTSRGALIDPHALLRELTSGRLAAVLDVTDPGPLPADSALHDLPNVFLTPHIAGSVGNELGRLGATVVDEIDQLVAGQPPLHQVLPTDLVRVA
ncbi:hydroxyacid dehydrogenase [Streptomyces sp. GbtcB7]|uniref:hydroxyacid dehydrogenase n=1 Tax=Streptomyces sp. GbtcB7 TaxID=2824752 RepID=UPI001C2FC5E1|nr:hydroxyacid dehydrogenase [Streptomyces sp. GbtcB7]